MKIAVVIPNVNGADMLVPSIASLRKQTCKHTLIIVDNGSTDGSLDLLRPMAKKGDIVLIEHERNLGFTGINSGFAYAIEKGYDAVASFNNDAIADPDWLQNMQNRLAADDRLGIVACKFLNANGSQFDSTGDILTIWGLPFPRGRDEPATAKYDKQNRIMGASGGSSLFRVAMLREVGIFDPDFFAYYEDIDISLRARLAGWEIYFEPTAKAYHGISVTSNRIKGFTTYQTMKNLPWVLIKDVPFPLLWHMIPRFFIAYTSFFAKALVSGRAWPAIKGLFASLWRAPKKIVQRWAIQRGRKITSQQLETYIVKDLPPNAGRLRRLRQAWWRLRGRAA